MSSAESNQRIVKNTALLYVRMLFTMVVTLFTSRVILNTLGVEDYGINNVVGGIVTMFVAISGSLSSSICRFTTYELGRGNKSRLKNIFSTGINIQLGMSLFVMVLAETIGGWFVNTQMNISPERMEAANWVFQCSIFSFVLGLLSVPYNATIIAHERMSVFAYISVIEVTLKLLIVYLLYVSPFDLLKTYSVLLLLVAALVRFIYATYCKWHFEECSYHWVKDTVLLKEMTSFAGWNLLGNGAYILNTQGVNVLTNLYFGVAVNAARGIATQVDTALKQFVNSFTTAINPQITKSYAKEDLAYMHQLVCKGAKFSAFLMIFFSTPILLETEMILKLWLKTVPDYSAIFVRWTILSSFVDTVLANSLVTSMFATGKIKRYQITVTSIGCLVFPLSWMAFKWGLQPQTGYIVYFVIYAILLFVRLYLLRDMIKLPPRMYVKNVLYKVLPVIVISFAVPGIFVLTLPSGWTRLLLVCLVCFIVTPSVEYGIGLTFGEKEFVKEKSLSVFNKLKKMKRI